MQAQASNPDNDNKALRDALQEHYKGKSYEPSSENEQTQDLALMLLLMESTNAINEDLQNFKSKNGNDYQISNGSVTSKTLFDQGAPSSPENINALLEFTLVAKGSFGEEGAFFNGAKSKTEFSMAAYAAELAGFNMKNTSEAPALDDDTKAKMDAEWATMQEKLGLASDPKVATPTSTPEPSKVEPAPGGAGAIP